MARLVVASLNLTDTMDAVQLQTSPRPRIRSAVFKARTGNTGSIYLATDSSAKSSGFELTAGSKEEWSLLPATVKGTTFWVWGASSGDRLDYQLLLEE